MINKKTGNSFQALGRLKTGEMNRTEAKYAKHLELLKQAGEVLWWRFDCVNLRIAPKCFYKTDFMVLTKDNLLQLHEVKGFMTDDALVKLKVVADTFPIPVIVIKWVKGQWEKTEY